MKLKSITLVCSVLFLVLVGACKKEGCDDQFALNYNSKVNSNNGSCLYELKAVFWYDDSTSVHLQNDNITSLRFFVDDNLIGTKLASEFWATEPDCGFGMNFRENSPLTTTSHDYYVRDQNDIVVWSGTLTLGVGVCISKEMTY